jgi:hypothetical protein
MRVTMGRSGMSTVSTMTGMAIDIPCKESRARRNDNLHIEQDEKDDRL